MSRLSLPIVLFLCWFAFIGCKKEETNQGDCGLPACDAKRTTVKTASTSTVTGVVYFHTAEKKYAIYVSQPGTYDSKDAGLVCEMPEAFRKEGIQVVFDGEYKTYCGKPTLAVAGQTYYYLHLSAIKLR